MTIRKEGGKLTIDCSSPAIPDVDVVVAEGIQHFEQAVKGLKTVKESAG